MKNTLETRLGIFFALALIGLFILMEMAGGLNVLTKTISVGARFSNIRDLKEGDPVKMAGVEIGKVAAIRFAEDRVLVVMNLDAEKSFAVKTDSTASVQFMGLMGQNYVAIEFGQTGLPILDEAELQTREQPDIGDLLARIDGVGKGIEQITDAFGGDQITDMLGPLADFLKENKDKVSDIISDLRISSAQIARGEGSIGRLIHDQALYETSLSTIDKLNKSSETLDLALVDAQSLLRDFRSGKGTLGKLATEESLYEEARVAMGFLREILEKINRGEGSVGNLVNDASLIDNAKAALQKVEKATESLEDQGPLSVLGLAAGRLF